MNPSTDEKSRARSSPRERFVSVGTKLAGVTVLVLAVVAGGVFAEVNRTQRSHLLAAKEIAATMVARLFSAGAAAPLSFGDEKGAKEQVSLLAANDQVVYGALWSLDPDDSTRVGPKQGEMRHGFGGEPVVSVHADVRLVRAPDWVLVEAPVVDPAGTPVGMAQVALSLARENGAIQSSERRTLWASLATTLGLATVLVLLSRALIVRPLGRLAAAAKRLEQGESAEIDVRSNDEVGRLARGFDAMTRAIANREQRISERNRDLRRVLDNAADGFITVDVAGSMSDERSGVLDRWFGPPRIQGSFLDYMDDVAPQVAESVRLGWEELREDVLPLELILHQLPRRFEREGRYFELDYRPVQAGASLERILVVIRDVTQQIERERAEQGQREMARLVRRMLADRTGFRTFFREAAALVSAIERDEGKDPAALKRRIHTLKGNCALFGIESVSRFCHDLEERMRDDADACNRTARGRLRELWSVATGAYEGLGGGDGDGIDVDLDEHHALVRALEQRLDHPALVSMVSVWRFERGNKLLARASEQLRSIAQRMGKGELQVRCEVTPPKLRLPQPLWSPFWTTFAHVLRNTIDHGIELPEERAARGKPAAAQVSLSIRAKEDEVEVFIADDGRGIDWERIRARAFGLGLPHATPADLEEALYADGVSSRSTATETSGRGIGMGAVREAVRALGGRIDVESVSGSGTTFRFVFPAAMLPHRPSVAPADAALEARGLVTGRRSIAAGAA